MRTRPAVVLMALVLVAVSCGDDDADPGTTAAGATTTTETGSTLPFGGGGDEVGGCTVNVTGDLETAWTGPDNSSAFTTDYWYTVDELRQQFEIFAVPEGETFEETMEREAQVFTFFLFNCQGDDGQLVTLSVSGDATRPQFPMGPGTYAITSGFFASEAGPTDFSMLFATGDDDVWGLDVPGTITISEWTGSHLVGSYSFGAIETFVDTPRRVTVTGTFELFCRTSTSC